MIVPGINGKESVIIAVNSNELGVGLKEREASLFKIKPSLTAQEIGDYLGESVQSFKSGLTDYLRKETKQMTTPNPFTSSNKIVTYALKYSYN
jgi:hypothetical protein